jgi:hypothetical protein
MSKRGKWGKSLCDVRGMNGSVFGEKRRKKEIAEFSITDAEKTEWKKMGWVERPPKKKKKKTKRKSKKPTIKKPTIEERWSKNLTGSLSGAIGTAKHMKSFTPEHIELVEKIYSMIKRDDG